MPKQDEYLARTAHDDNQVSREQTLRDHLTGVAHLAEQFAEAFGSAEWGRLVGLWHDLGKYQDAFQKRLRDDTIRVEHSGAGAALAMERNPGLGLPPAFVIAAHHAGLRNRADTEDRAKDNGKRLAECRPRIPADIADIALPKPPDILRPVPSGDRTAPKRSLEFWIRFLFSALVDADRLDAARFDNPADFDLRRQHESIAALRERLDGHIDGLVARISDEQRQSPVNKARAEVLDSCRQAADEKPGLFSLTVPTGGGKTLSALSFALRHAEKHGLRRVIVVIPYTSIIEQNADVYRKALGDKNVLEHHSNLDIEKQKKESEEDVARRHELATENWDAPVIVTTTVQFFESLFSNRASRCRKLHNVAKSVIVLDEVQTLPPEFLITIVDGLKELAARYGCSIVLSTATPPALSVEHGFKGGLTDVRDVIAEPARLGRALERVTYSWPEKGAEPVEWESLADTLAADDHRQVLAIVHKRKDARDLARLLQARVPKDEVIHLSALMCPAHRKDVLEEVNRRLAAGEPCRVVSTQLVEAGVDVDFPIVYRAMGGLDSIVQAAGRCNREGKLAEKGRVIVFRAPGNPPPGTPSEALKVADSLMTEKGGAPDVTDPACFEVYFRTLYNARVTDGIRAFRESLDYPTVARKFRLIEDSFTKTIVVPYGDEGQERMDRLRKDGPSRETLRAVQPYTVSIYENAFTTLLQKGALDPLDAERRLYSLSSSFTHAYSETFGLADGDEVEADQGASVV